VIHREAEQLLAAGAALDDLEPAERSAWNAHRAGCRDCAVLESELGMVLADLALVVPERIPPPDLFAGIRLAIEAEESRGGRQTGGPAPVAAPPLRSAPAAEAVPVTPPAATPVTSLAAVRSSRRPALAAIALAAVFGLVAVGLGVRTVGLQQELDQSVAQVSALRAEIQGQGAVMAAAMNPQHVTVALESEPLAAGASAVVVFVPGTDSSYVVAQDLPATPSGHGYQLWYADAAGVHPLQTVPYDGNGAFVAPLDVDLASSTAVMITLEESGGAQGEPGEQVVFGEL
jgi:hypothetical protein